jgi:hypothetical protein
MARTVTIPVAIAIRKILSGEISNKGVVRPTTADIYVPILKEMQEKVRSSSCFVSPSLSLSLSLSLSCQNTTIHIRKCMRWGGGSLSLPIIPSSLSAHHLSKLFFLFLFSQLLSHDQAWANQFTSA